MNTSQLSQNEIADALSFFASQGFVADYNDQEQKITGGTEKLVWESGGVEGYVNGFRIDLIADKWTVRLKIGQIPFDVPLPNLKFASKFVVNLYKPSEPFQDGTITSDEAVSKLLKHGFDAFYTPGDFRYHPNKGSITICYEDYCSNGIGIYRNGSYYFVMEFFSKPFSRKRLYIGDTLLEVIDFLCSDLFDTGAYTSINSG
ncbi:MAG: hypothetical protein GC179_12395 [Anaerolineaceae bacterium]|nr:hypothetical protein [Anaerolineaceae bacterium]